MHMRQHTDTPTTTVVEATSMPSAEHRIRVQNNWNVRILKTRFIGQSYGRYGQRQYAVTWIPEQRRSSQQDRLV